MAIEKRELDVAKEADDVLAFVVELIRIIKEKGDYTSLIDELVAAVNGIDQVQAEAKDIKALSTVAGMRIGEIVELFLKEEAPQVEAQ